MKTPPASWCIGIALLATAAISSAQNLQPVNGVQIGWASDAFATNLMADGITRFEESAKQIRFELGTFAPGFDPQTATPEQWASSWIVLQGTDYDLNDQQFIQTATLGSNASPFLANSQAYIWGYTSKDVKQDSEWILLGASAWKWPEITATQPSIFTVSQALPADAIFGAVNPAGGAFHMQFAYVAVPEPSMALLAGLAACGWMVRRRR